MAIDVNSHPEVRSAAVILGRFGLEAGFLVPTKNAMEKGIIDATWPLREYLARTGFHSYLDQGQGTESKRVIDANFVRGSSTEAVRVSMYRPNTKKGDPRIWIYNLTSLAAPEDVIALVVSGSALLIVNCSQTDLRNLLEDELSPLGKLTVAANGNAGTVKQLLELLRGIGNQGFVPSHRKGDTGIGFTLESLLGIRANSRREPDFHGIELKSKRSRSSNPNASPRHITLFSKTPDWLNSTFSARHALETFGYKDAETNRLQLFCSIDAREHNSLGFTLNTRNSDGRLQTLNNRRKVSGEEVFFWAVETLRSTFKAKHRETFWVDARCKRLNGVEYFHYFQARHTKNPPMSTFERLLASGGICVDLTMSEKGTSAVRDHGYLFRVYGPHFKELFPEVGVYSLTDRVSTPLSHTLI